MPPSLRPLRRIRPVRPRGMDRAADAERRAFIALINSALRDVAVMASARGVCALQAAHLAHLPLHDLALVASACECASCARARMH